MSFMLSCMKRSLEGRGYKGFDRGFYIQVHKEIKEYTTRS